MPSPSLPPSVAVAVELRPIGRVQSSYSTANPAPHQFDQGARAARLVFIPEVREALADIAIGDELIVVTWLDRARRDVLRTHPQNDPAKPLAGVFSTRSPHRPNPIGLHRVRVADITDGLAITVASLEAFDGTPILDLKAVYGATADA